MRLIALLAVMLMPVAAQAQTVDIGFDPPVGETLHYEMRVDIGQGLAFTSSFDLLFTEKTESGYIASLSHQHLKFSDLPNFVDPPFPTIRGVELRYTTDEKGRPIAMLNAGEVSMELDNRLGSIFAKNSEKMRQQGSSDAEIAQWPQIMLLSLVRYRNLPEERIGDTFLEQPRQMFIASGRSFTVGQQIRADYEMIISYGIWPLFNQFWPFKSIFYLTLTQVSDGIASFDWRHVLDQDAVRMSIVDALVSLSKFLGIDPEGPQGNQNWQQSGEAFGAMQVDISGQSKLRVADGIMTEMTINIHVQLGVNSYNKKATIALRN